MKYIWLVLMGIIILRSVRLLMKRYESRGKSDAFLDELPFNSEDLFLESTPAGEPGESGPGLNLPEYPASRGGELTTVSNDSGHKGRQVKPAGERRAGRGKNIDSLQELYGRCDGPELFDDGISQREFIKGMVWSQILGSRGGIQADKRFKHRY